jgi:hypothetical protein
MKTNKAKREECIFQRHFSREDLNCKWKCCARKMFWIMSQSCKTFYTKGQKYQVILEGDYTLCTLWSELNVSCVCQLVTFQGYNFFLPTAQKATNYSQKVHSV